MSSQSGFPPFARPALRGALLGAALLGAAGPIVPGIAAQSEGCLPTVCTAVAIDPPLGGTFAPGGNVGGAIGVGDVNGGTPINPASAVGETDPILVEMFLDSDGDGLTDYDETSAYGTSPYAYDTDGDGYGDGGEVVGCAGSGAPATGNPLDPADYPVCIN